MVLLWVIKTVDAILNQLYIKEQKEKYNTVIRVSNIKGKRDTNVKIKGLSELNIYMNSEFVSVFLKDIFHLCPWKVTGPEITRITGWKTHFPRLGEKLELLKNATSV